MDKESSESVNGVCSEPMVCKVMWAPEEVQATNMRHNGAELGDITIAMRHEDPVTTVRCYLRDDPELKKATLKMAGKGLLAG